MEDKPFSLVDTLIALMMVVPLDTAEYFLAPTGFSIILMPFDLVTSAAFILWLTMKQGASSRLMARITIFGVASVMDLAPLVEILPARTLAIIVVIWMSNRPD